MLALLARLHRPALLGSSAGTHIFDMRADSHALSPRPCACRQTGHVWRRVVQGAIPERLSLRADEGAIPELLNLAWAAHEVDADAAVQARFPSSVPASRHAVKNQGCRTRVP